MWQELNQDGRTESSLVCLIGVRGHRTSTRTFFPHRRIVCFTLKLCVRKRAFVVGLRRRLDTHQCTFEQNEAVCLAICQNLPHMQVLRQRLRRRHDLASIQSHCGMSSINPSASSSCSATEVPAATAQSSESRNRAPRYRIAQEFRRYCKQKRR